MTAKDELRLAMKERLRNMSERDRTIESRVVCKELSKLFKPQPAVFAAFMPYLDEPDITLLLKTVLSSNVRLVLPAVLNNKLVFREVHNLSVVRRNPVTTIMEAPESAPIIDDALIELALIPGRAFTRAGARMGRGNGGYDRWISEQRKRNPATRMAGVCFECQLLTELPMEAHDQNVDMVVTSRGIFSAGSA